MGRNPLFGSSPFPGADADAFADYFPVKLLTSDGLTPAGFTFDEWNNDTTNVPVKKEGGRSNTTSDLAYAFTGSFAVGDYALCRRCTGAGGVSWELVPMVPAANAGGFFAVLTAANPSGVVDGHATGYKWRKVKATGTGIYTEWDYDGAESPGYTAVPAVTAANAKGPPTLSVGEIVWMLPANAAGVETFHYNAGFASKVGSTYYGGVWGISTVATQTFQGPKQLDGSWIINGISGGSAGDGFLTVRDSITGNTGLTYETLRYKARTTGSAPPVPPNATAMGDEFASFTQHKFTTVGPHTYHTSGSPVLGGAGLWPTSTDRTFSVAGPGLFIGQVAIGSVAGIAFVNPGDAPPSLWVMQDSSGVPHVNPTNWLCIGSEAPSSGVFPYVRGVSILSSYVTDGYGYVAVGLNDQTLMYDFVGGAVGGSRYGGGTGGGYWRGFKWQGGDAGPFRLANGVITGYSTTSTTAGAVTYFNGANWVVLNPPGGGASYVLGTTSGTTSWVSASPPGPPGPPGPPSPPGPPGPPGPPAPPVAIGGAVGSGTANTVLFVDGSGNLGDSSNFGWNNSTTVFTVSGSTATFTFDGANGASFSNGGGKFASFTSSWGGRFSDGTYAATLANGSVGGQFTNGSLVNVSIAGATYAANFTDGTRTVIICDGTNNITYTAGTPGNWAGAAPTDVWIATDRLAQWFATNAAVLAFLGLTTQP